MRTVPRRTLVIFWSTTAAAVFLLGGAVGSARAILDGGGAVDVGIGVTSGVGVVAALLVAGRIVLVTARLERRARGSRPG